MKNTEILIKLALEEDGVFNDVTTKSLISKSKKAKAVLIANKPGILCGVRIFADVIEIGRASCRERV